MNRIKFGIIGSSAVLAATLLGTAGTPAGAASTQKSTTPPGRSVTALEQEVTRRTSISQIVRTARPADLPEVDHGRRTSGTNRPNGPEVKIPGQPAAGALADTATTPVTSGGVGGTTGVNAPVWPLAYNANPNRQVGKLFFYDTVNARQSWCSATAITSANKSTIVTAGHCVWSPDPDKNGIVSGNGKWNTNFQFCPGYENSCKLGVWTSRYVATTPSWFYGYGTAHTYDFRDDVAVILLNKDSSGRYLTDVVGSQGIWFNGTTNVWRTALGYPGTDSRFPGYTYSAQDLIYCQNNDTLDSTYTGTMWIPCTMTGGASGGPWLTWVNGSTWGGYVNSVNSHKPWGGQYMNGPYFDAAENTLYSTYQSK